MCSFIPGKDMLLGGEYLVTPYNNFRHIGLGSVINLGYNYDYLFPDDN
jgi:hypothetical protein